MPNLMDSKPETSHTSSLINASSKTLSIIVTAHNMQNYILDCLNSIISSAAESLKSCEIIIINDSSEDETGKIMIEFAKKRQVAYFQTNFKNIGRVRNYGVGLCTGDYITMVDGDDRLFAESLHKIIHFLEEKKPDIYISPLHACKEIMSKNRTCEWRKPTKMTQNESIKSFLIHKKFQAHFIGKIIHRDLFTHSCFPEYTCYEDAWLFPIILSKSENIYFGGEFYIYNVRENSLSNTINKEKISYLASSILKMDDSFGEKYRHLTACHAINLLWRYRELISSNNLGEINSILTRTSKLKLILSPSVRLSFKKKYAKLLAGKK